MFTVIPRRGVPGIGSVPAPFRRLISIEMLVQGARATRDLEVTTEVTATWVAH